MEGCGPCNATRPEWDKLKNVLKRFQKDNNVAIELNIKHFFL